MAKASSVWECQNCGAQFPKWSGQCPDCRKWNSLVETPIERLVVSPSGRRTSPQSKVEPINWQKVAGAQKLHRPTAIAELDRVLGGGLVPGGVILIAGEPGIGKSTLLSQLALTEKDVLYVNGEESNIQVAGRLKRLSPRSDSRVMLFPDTNVDSVIARAASGYKLVIVDSIQIMSSPGLKSAPGSISQIRESALRLITAAKTAAFSLMMVGHFTKEGEVAGPKVLEHMVDTVLVMEGDRSGNLRILRSLKNRFGPVDEVGIFSMDDGGMREVKNPAELLVGDLAAKAPGSVLGCVLEGQRPLVLEIQALAVPTKLSFPRRIGQGISERRLQLLCAVIEKHLGLGIGEKDVFVNVAGGLKSSDPGLDLPVVAAIVSSARKTIDDRRLKVGVEDRKSKMDLSSIIHPPPPSSILHHPSSTPIFCGEIGLLGEVRMVPGWPRREKEVGRLGLGKLIGKAEINHIGELRKFL